MNSYVLKVNYTPVQAVAIGYSQSFMVASGQMLKITFLI